MPLICCVSSFSLANALLDQAKPGQLTIEIHNGSLVVYQWSTCTPCMIHMCLQGYPQCPKENQPPPFSLSTPMVKSVVVTKLVSNINPTHVMIVAVVNI